MPTIIKQDGFLIIIMLNDHRPPHIHAFKGKGRARITLGNSQERPRLMEAYALKDADIRKAFQIVIENQEILLKAWEKYHG